MDWTMDQDLDWILDRRVVDDDHFQPFIHSWLLPGYIMAIRGLEDWSSITVTVRTRNVSQIRKQGHCHFND